jgi:hypothetical protein
MSIAEGGKEIRCDGMGCQASAAVPIALHPRLAEGGPNVRPTDGWLYVVGNGKELHFCPNCTRQRLKTLSATVKPAVAATTHKEY